MMYISEKNQAHINRLRRTAFYHDDIDYIVKCYEAKGFSVSEDLFDLFEYIFTIRDIFYKEKYDEYEERFRFDFRWALQRCSYSSIAKTRQIIGKEILPIGTCYYEGVLLFIDNDGALYFSYTDIKKLGNNFDESFSNLFTNIELESYTYN